MENLFPPADAPEARVNEQAQEVTACSPQHASHTHKRLPGLDEDCSIFTHLTLSAFALDDGIGRFFI